MLYKMQLFSDWENYYHYYYFNYLAITLTLKVGEGGVDFFA